MNVRKKHVAALALICLTAVAVSGCTTKVQLDRPLFITETEAKARWAAADARKDTAPLDPSDKEKTPTQIVVTDPGQVSDQLLRLKDEIDFTQGCEKTFIITQLSQEELDKEKLEKIGQAFRAEIASLVNQAYVGKSYTARPPDPQGKAPVMWLFDAKLAAGGAKHTVKVDLPDPKVQSQVKVYVAATLPRSTSTLWLLKSTGSDLVEVLPVGKDNVPIGAKGVLHAYPFTVTLKVENQKLLPLIDPAALAKLQRIISAIDNQLAKGVATSPTGAPAWKQTLNRLLSGVKVNVGFNIPATIGEDSSALGLIAERAVDVCTDHVLSAILQDYREVVGDNTQPDFAERLVSSRNRSALRSMVADIISFRPLFYQIALRRPSDKVKLTGAQEFSVQMMQMGGGEDKAQAQLLYLADEYLRFLVLRNEFQTFYVDPARYKHDIGWVNRRVGWEGYPLCDLTFAVVFGSKSQFLGKGAEELGIVAPTVQHEEIARSAVLTALAFSGCKQRGMDTFDLPIERELSATRELARKIAKQYDVKGGVYARFRFVPKPRGQVIRAADFSGGTATLYASATGVGPQWIRPVKQRVEHEEANALEVSLLVKSRLATRGAKIIIPLIELNAPAKPGAGVKQARCENVELICEPIAGLDQAGDPVPMMAIVKAKGIRGNLGMIRDILAKSRPHTWSISREVVVGGKKWRRREGYEIEEGGVKLLDVAYMPNLDGRIKRIDSDTEITVRFSGADKEVVAFLPVSNAAPWNRARQIALALDVYGARAEELLKETLGKKGYLIRGVGDKSGEQLFVSELREQILRELPAWLPTPCQSAKEAMDALYQKVYARAIGLGRHLEWGVKQDCVARARAEIAKVLGRGTGISLSVPSVAAADSFGSYGSFLLDLITLRDHAVKQLTGPQKPLPLYIQLQRDGRKWTEQGSERMYIASGDENEIIIGALLKSETEELPKVFFVRIDDKFRMFCTDGSIPKTRRGIWPRWLRYQTAK